MLPLGLSDVQAAVPLVAPRVRRTPLVSSRTLSERLGTRVSLKLEVFQKTGSFKPRGAFNQLLHLTSEQRRRGVVGVSGGNFAQGLAYAGRELGVPVLIIVPEGTPAHYLAATRGYGAEVEMAPSIAEAFFRADAYRAAGRAALHPFDDPWMMAGNGTLGLEVVEDAPDLTDLFVSIGGGGLMAGVAAAVKGLRPEARVWGVETLGCHAMRLALDLGRPVEMKPTSIAKTLARPVGVGGDPGGGAGLAGGRRGGARRRRGGGAGAAGGTGQGAHRAGGLLHPGRRRGGAGPPRGARGAGALRGQRRPVGGGRLAGALRGVGDRCGVAGRGGRKGARAAPNGPNSAARHASRRRQGRTLPDAAVPGRGPTMTAAAAGTRRRARLEWALALVAAAASVALMCWVGRDMWFRLDVWDFLAGREAGSFDSWVRPHAGHLQAVTVGLHRLLYGLFGLDFWPWYYLPAIVGYAGLALLVWRVLLRRGADRGIAFAAYLVVLFLGVSAFLSSIAVGGLIVLALLLLVAERLDADAAPSLLVKALVTLAFLVMATSSSLGVAGLGACLLTVAADRPPAPLVVDLPPRAGGLRRLVRDPRRRRPAGECGLGAPPEHPRRRPAAGGQRRGAPVRAGGRRGDRRGGGGGGPGRRVRLARLEAPAAPLGPGLRRGPGGVPADGDPGARRRREDPPGDDPLQLADHPAGGARSSCPTSASPGGGRRRPGRRCCSWRAAPWSW